MTGYHPPPSPVTPKDRGLPSTDPQHDEALALSRADHSLASAFVAIGLAFASLTLLWFGRSLLLLALSTAVAATVASMIAWSATRRGDRPAGVAFAALALGIAVSAIVVVLWL